MSRLSASRLRRLAALAPSGRYRVDDALLALARKRRASTPEELREAEARVARVFSNLEPQPAATLGEMARERSSRRSLS